MAIAAAGGSFTVVSITEWLSKNKTPLSFWFLGLLNNSPYVIMIASAKTISEGGTALVFLANVLPSLTIKLTAPYWFDKVSYHIRMVLASSCMFSSFVVVAIFSSHDKASKQTVICELLGVALASTQGGLGEASLLALAGKCDAGCKKRKCITCFSSGTGLAGVFGFLWKFVCNDWLGLSMKQTLWLATTLSFMYAGVYVKNLWHVVQSHNGYQDISSTSSSALEEDVATPPSMITTSTTTTSVNATIITSDDLPEYHEAQPIRDSPLHPVEIIGENGSRNETTAPGEDDDWEDEYRMQQEDPSQSQHGDAVVVQKIEDMTTVERLKLVVSLYPYMIPLFVVYVAEYTLQAGTWTAIGFPVTSLEARDKFFEYSNWMYQVGVFLSRSSGTVYTAPLSVLWLMPALQTVNVFLFMWIAKAHFWYNYTLLIPCFYVGLLGGAVYVNGYTRICADLPIEHREFALATTSVAESLGIVVADILGLFVQSCLYRANGLEGAIVSCPVGA